LTVKCIGITIWHKRRLTNSETEIEGIIKISVILNGEPTRKGTIENVERFMILFDCSWLFMTYWNYLWFFMIIQNYLWLFMTGDESLRLYMTVNDYFWSWIA
jgi:hypothetical protein